jgi:DNA invertase Pin-like site-specific DNA recombinase
LKRLLDDVQANKVDTIAVYKVDRLTRSLPYAIALDLKERRAKPWPGFALVMPSL